MKKVLIAAALALASLTAHRQRISPSRQQDTFAKVRQADSRVLFVDVRDPVEIMFVGFTDAVHVNIPYLIVDRTPGMRKRVSSRLYQNPDFAARIKAELDKRGWGVDTEIITMCRSGSERGEPSASFLRTNGFPNARFVVEHGFQGAAIKDGPQAGFRLQNGWQNSGLPWSMKMNPDKMYRSDRK
jgi:rhodanese-related sulfurtransferase